MAKKKMLTRGLGHCHKVAQTIFGLTIRHMRSLSFTLTTTVYERGRVSTHPSG